MNKKHPKKGQYGYRNYHKKMELAMILLGIAAILLQLGARNLTDKESLKNILTVMAIVSVLPTANVASPFLASIRYRTPAREFYEKLSAYEGRTAILYDLILTSREQIMPMDGVCVHPSGVYFYCSNPKVKADKAETFINDIFRAHRLDPHAKVITDERAFFKRAASLKPASEYEDDGSVDYTMKLLKEISM